MELVSHGHTYEEIHSTQLVGLNLPMPACLSASCVVSGIINWRFG